MRAPGDGTVPSVLEPDGLAIAPKRLNGDGRGGKRNGDGDVPHLCSVFLNEPIDPRIWRLILRKEVIQPQVPLRLPCYDFIPVADPTVVACLLAVSTTPSGKANSHDVTGGVYKARERIHRGMLIRDY